MNRIQQIAPITQIQRQPHEVFAKLAAGPFILAKGSVAAAVLVSVEQWNQVADELAQRRFTKREVEAIVAACLADLRNDPTIAHDDLVQMIMERRAARG